MRSEIVPASEWLKNFTKTASDLVKDNQAQGYQVKGFIMTFGIFDKLTEALGYEPTDFLGYVIELLEQTEDQFRDEGDFVLIKGDALN